MISYCETCGQLRSGSEKEEWGGYIYFLYARELNKIKIGFSKNPAPRIKKLQQNIPVKLTTLKLMRGSMKHEKRLFHLWKEFREFGEWFTAVECLMQWIESLAEGDTIKFSDIENLRKELLAKTMAPT